MGEVGVVDVGQFVASCGELLGVGVADVAQWVESLGNEDGRGQACLGLGVQGREVGAPNIVGA